MAARGGGNSRTDRGNKRKSQAKRDVLSSFAYLLHYFEEHEGTPYIWLSEVHYPFPLVPLVGSANAGEMITSSSVLTIRPSTLRGLPFSERARRKKNGGTGGPMGLNAGRYVLATQPTDPLPRGGRPTDVGYLNFLI